MLDGLISDENNFLVGQPIEIVQSARFRLRELRIFDRVRLQDSGGGRTRRTGRWWNGCEVKKFDRIRSAFHGENGQVGIEFDGLNGAFVFETE